MFAYAGKILHVNLTTGETKTEPLSEQMAKDYIGGIGLGIRLLFDNSKPGTDAYDPDNPIIYLTGPLSGTMGPTGGNSYAVVSKSPATGGIGKAKPTASLVQTSNEQATTQLSSQAKRQNSLTFGLTMTKLKSETPHTSKTQQSTKQTIKSEKNWATFTSVFQPSVKLAKNFAGLQQSLMTSSAPLEEAAWAESWAAKT